MTEEVKKNSPPVIRLVRKEGEQFIEDAVLFENKGEGKHILSGRLKEMSVIGFLNQSENGPFISLRARVGEEYKEVATMNAQNDRKDGSKVFFDTLSIRPKNPETNEKEATLWARVTKTISPELHEKIGFTSPLEDRPKFVQKDEVKVAAVAAADDDFDDDLRF